MSIIYRKFFNAVYRAPATGAQSRGIVHRQPLWLIGWHGTALGCRRRGPAGNRPPRLHLSGNSKWRRRLSD